MYKRVKSSGRHIVELEASKIGSDFNICIYGGGRPHIGDAAVATYNHRNDAATVVGLVPDNRGDGFAHKAAKQLAVALKATVCVTCGIHCDEAEKEEKKILGKLVDELLDNIKLEFAR
jgi:gallate decarboxylase subunit D